MKSNGKGLILFAGRWQSGSGFSARADNKKAEEYFGKMYGAAPYDRTTQIYQVIGHQTAEM